MKLPILTNQKNKNLPELEKNETVLSTVTGILSKVQGNKHSTGGENINLEEGSKMFSSAIKFPKEIVAGILDKKPSQVKKLSPAELSTKYPTEQYDAILNDLHADKRAKNSARLMKEKNLAKLETIFQAQEEFKESKGVQQGKLLKEQGLNSDLEPIYQSGGKYQVAGDRTISGQYNPSKKYLDPQQMIAIQNQYLKLGLKPPVTTDNFGYTPNVVKTKENSGWLNDHDFIKTGLANVKYSWNKKNNKWHKGTDLAAIERIKKEKNLTDQQIREITGDYQAQSIGLNPDGTYKQDPLWVARRKEVFDHHQHNNKGAWKHQNFKQITLPDGSIDYRIDNYVDDGFVDGKALGDNWKEQIQFKPTITPYRDPLAVVEPLKPRIDFNNLPKPTLPSLPTKDQTPTTQTNRPLANVELEVPKELEKAKLSSYLQLFNREKAVPYLRNDNQTVAYQRFLPMNTLAIERSQNFLNRTYNNSDATSQMSQAVNADNYAKTLDGISDVQLKNYQGQLQIDNQNNQLYMNAFNSNELAKNNNMADYIGKTQIISDQFDRETEQLKDNIRQYDLQRARSNDDLSMNKLDAILTNKKFYPTKLPDNKVGIEINPNHSYQDLSLQRSPLFNQNQELKQTAELVKDMDLDPQDGKVLEKLLKYLKLK